MTYADLVREFRANPREIPTDPLIKKTPLWFYVYANHGAVYVASGREHPNASRISYDRRLPEKEISFMLELYQRRKRKEQVSLEAQRSKHQSYWFGIFKELSL